MLEIRNLSKTYDDGTEALKNISFTVPDGQFLVLIGLSGSGKSTLLRCINRLVEPTSGDVIWNGKNITTASGAELRRHRREIGMIFQHFNLVKRLTVLTNVITGHLGYGGGIRALLNWWPEEVKEEAMRNLKRVGITEKGWNRADALSGGQQQRVGIARAMMQKPKMMLADEPVASLDPALSHTIMDYLQGSQQERWHHGRLLAALPEPGARVRRPHHCAESGRDRVRRLAGPDRRGAFHGDLRR